MRGLKKTFTICRSTGVRAFARAEEFSFQQALRNSTAIDRHKRPAGALATGVYSLRRQLLTRTRFTPNQDRRHAARGFGDMASEGVYGRAIAYYALQGRVIWLRIAACRSRCRCCVFRGVFGNFWRQTCLSSFFFNSVFNQHISLFFRLLRLAFSHGLGHHATQLLQIHRFADVVKRARFQRFHRVFCRPIGGNHYGALFAPALLQLGQHFQPQAIGQTHIADNRSISLRGYGFACGRHRTCGMDTVALAHQR